MPVRTNSASSNSSSFPSRPPPLAHNSSYAASDTPSASVATSGADFKPQRTVSGGSKGHQAQGGTAAAPFSRQGSDATFHSAAPAAAASHSSNDDDEFYNRVAETPEFPDQPRSKSGRKKAVDVQPVAVVDSAPVAAAAGEEYNEWDAADVPADSAPATAEKKKKVR